jgi:hypothetical protein
MGKPIRVPDPVYSKAERQAERQDSSLGEVVRGWMEDAERAEELEARLR